MRAICSVSGALALTLAVLLGHGTASGPAAAKPADDAQRTRPQTAQPKAHTPSRPNFVVIMVDDQAMNSFSRRVMPQTFRRLADRGTTFANSFAAPPLCCPARAGFQTGQYPHNHGVVFNNYELLVDKHDVISTWMDDAGYETGFVGKYMNKYTSASPPPGYDFSWAHHHRPYYINYAVSVNGKIKRMGDRPRDYSTDAITRNSVGFIRRATDKGEPFFLWTSYYAPHNSNAGIKGRCGERAPLPARRDRNAFRHASLPQGPDFNERDVSDKSAFTVGQLPRLLPSDRRHIVEAYRCTLATMRAVDRGVARIDEALERAGVADNTAVFYISDNGYFFGEHRKPKGKGIPYEEALRVPLLARVPEKVLGAEADHHLTEPVTNIDLAPTIVDLAGVDATRTMDGRSIAGLLRGDRSTWPQDRAILLELGKCRYQAVRTAYYLYVELYASTYDGCELAERELYDVSADPHQIHNLLGEEPQQLPVRLADAAAQREVIADLLAARVKRLSQCSGIEGRDATANPCE